MKRGQSAIRTDLQSLGHQGGVRVDVSALRVIGNAIAEEMSNSGLLGVQVRVMSDRASSESGQTVYFVLDLPFAGGRPNPSLPESLATIAGTRGSQ